MRNATTICITVALALGAPLVLAQTQPETQVSRQPGKATATRSVKVTATITAIDPATRAVTLKSANGKVAEVAVGDEVRNFDQLKVGDLVNIEYKQALALSLKKEAGPPSANQSETIKRSEPGAKPGGTATREVTVHADVVAVNAGTRMVTLKGPGGNLVDLEVEDPEQLKNIKKGDQVQAVYSEALAIAVTPSAAKK
jgi:Cu/Ag efflux protein CusF